jgi:TonB family protein
MKTALLLAALAIGLARLEPAADAAPAPVVTPCTTCNPTASLHPATGRGRDEPPGRLFRAAFQLEAPEPLPGWHQATDELAVEALQLEILRNVGKQTQEADYPEEARRWSWSGTTLVQVVMGVDGKMKTVSVQRTSGFRVLDEQALQMVRRVPFTHIPERLKGREVTVTLPIGFYFADP